MPPPPPPPRLRPSLGLELLHAQANQHKLANIFASSRLGSHDSASALLLSLSRLVGVALRFVLSGLAQVLPNSYPVPSVAMDNHHHHHQRSGSDSMAAHRSCSMNMIFNSDPIGTCIVFRQFYVSGTTVLVGYLVLLFLLAMVYEYLRLAAQRFDTVSRIKLSSRPASTLGTLKPGGLSISSSRTPPPASPEEPSDPSRKNWGRVSVPRHIQVTRSLFYVGNVALSFFLMLVVMTYNAQIIAAVLAGAFVGHFLFHRELSFDDGNKGMACH